MYIDAFPFPPSGELSSIFLVLVGDREFGPTFGSAPLEDESSALSTHASTKAKFPVSLCPAGLVGALHGNLLLHSIGDGTKAPIDFAVLRINTHTNSKDYAQVREYKSLMSCSSIALRKAALKKNHPRASRAAEHVRASARLSISLYFS